MHSPDKLLLIIFLDIITHVLQYWQDLVHLTFDHLFFKQLKNRNCCLEKHEDAIKEVEVPDPRDQLEIKRPRIKRHEPLIYVMLWLDILQLKMLTQLG